MIEFTKSFKVGDSLFTSLEQAQEHELALLVGATAAPIILKEKERILNILTTTPNSKPKARKINGGRKPRSAKPVTNQPSEPQSTEPQL
jgi:hypothetical protein